MARREAPQQGAPGGGAAACLRIELDATHLITRRSSASRVQSGSAQHLHVLAVLDLPAKAPPFDVTPRTFLFAGKARARLRHGQAHIALINAVGQVINNDVNARQHLRVVFVRTTACRWPS